jgi:hypothetical protein
MLMLIEEQNNAGSHGSRQISLGLKRMAARI